MPDDKTPLYKLKSDTQGCCLLIALRSYLMRMYNFKDE